MEKPLFSREVRDFLTGPLQRLILALADPDGEEVSKQFELFIRREPCWQKELVLPAEEIPSKPNLLNFVGTIVIPASSDQPCARDKFRVNTNRNAPVKIEVVDPRFSKEFFTLEMGPTVERSISYSEILKESTDIPIIVELGGEEKVETLLNDLHYLISQQGDGQEEGPLHTNGVANLFYIRDSRGVLRPVNAYWRANGNGWGLAVHWIGDIEKCIDGIRVFYPTPKDPETK